MWVYRKHIIRRDENDDVMLFDWQVGYFRPDSTWYPVERFNDSEEAAARVHYLNGGN